MTFKFEYKFYKKFSISDDAGFLLIIDDEFANIECCTIDYLSRITHNKYYNLSKESKNEIKKIIKDNKKVFNINSYIYNEGKFSDIEQMFYFELGDLNRKIEGSNIFPDQNLIENKEAINLLLNVFEQISKVLLKDKLILKLNYFNTL